MLAVVALAGCGSNAVEAQRAPVLADLQPFLGREVTVTAEVAELESPRAFTVIDREGSGAEPLLVVHPERPEPVAEDLPITVTGTVGIFDAQRNLVGAQDPARLTQYDGKPYIDASRLAAPDPE